MSIKSTFHGNFKMIFLSYQLKNNSKQNLQINNQEIQIRLFENKAHAIRNGASL